MNVTFLCPGCERQTSAEVAAETRSIACRHCRVVLDLPADTFVDGRLRRCVACPSEDLFVRKDFPPRLGVLITVTGFFLATAAWYYHQAVLTFAILFATAAIDFVLYLFLGDALSCYRCGAHYRDVENLDQYDGFQLETHERHRQTAARQQRTVGRGQ